METSATPATPAGPVGSSNKVNLNQMRSEEAEREGMKRQRNNDITRLQDFETLTLPTNNKTNEFNTYMTRDQLEFLFKKLNTSNSLTPGNRRYIQAVINSSKPNKGLFKKKEEDLLKKN